MNFFKKLKEEVINSLSGGFTPKKVALTVAMGMVFGTVPFAVSTLLCTVAGILFRLNQPLIQFINFLVFPLQILFFIPYLKIGEVLLGQKTIPLNYFEIKEIFELPLKLFILKLGKAIIFALTGWVIVSPIIFILTFKISLFLIKRIKKEDQK